MVPANNTTMERELPQWLPAGSRVTTVRIPRGKGLLTADTIGPYQQSALELARAFAGDDYDCVAYGCTAAGFIGGPAVDRALADELGVVTGKPVVTTAGAMCRVLRNAHVRRVAVVTPYLAAVNERLAAFLTDEGIVVDALATLGAADVDALGRLTGADVEALARQTMTAAADGLFIACSQLPARDVALTLEAEWGKPVWSSIRATAHELVAH